MTWIACLALAASVLLAGCGEDGAADTSTRAPSAQDVASRAIIDAYDRTLGSPYRATMMRRSRYDASRASGSVRAAFRGQGGTTTMTIEAESAERLRAIVDLPRVDRDATVVLYDGETFVSIDGREFLAVADELGDLFSQLASLGSADVARALRDVRDEGVVTEGGARLHRYSATLDPGYLAEIAGRLVDGLGVDPSAISFTDSRLEVDLFPDGTLARQQTAATARIDLSGLTGTRAIVEARTDTEQRIRPAVAPITIERPRATGQIRDAAELGRLLAG